MTKHTKQKQNRHTVAEDPERARFDKGFRDGLVDHAMKPESTREYVVKGAVKDPYVDGYRRGHLAGQQAEKSLGGDLTSADAWASRMENNK